jgi:hypothetical protein
MEQASAATRPGDGAWRLIVGVLAGVPLIVGAVVDAVGGWMPTGDEATIVLRARDVFSAHMPLLGQFSEASAYLPRGQFVYAPGPSLYWLLAVPAQFVGRWPWAPLVWTASVEAGVVVGIVWLAGDLGGRLLAVATALGIAVLTASLGARNLYSPWSVNVPVLPLVLLVYVTWAILLGRYRLLPLAVLLVSFEVQADPSFGYVSVVLTGVILIAMTRAWWRTRGLPAAARRDAGLGRPTMVLSVLVGVALWLPALVQQATNHPGNLTLLVRASRRQGGREGVLFGLAILGKVVVRWPFLEFNEVPLNAGSGAPLSYVVAGSAVLALLVALLVIATQRRSTSVVAGLVASLGVGVGLVVAAALLPSDHLSSGSFWLLGWSPDVGFLVWIIIGWATWSLWVDPALISHTPRSVRRMRPLLVAGGIVVMVLVAASDVGYLVARPDPRRAWYPVVRKVAADLQRSPHQRYAVGAQMAPVVPLMVGQALVLRLAAAGVPVGANSGFERNLGMHYRLPRDGSVPRIVIYGDYNRYGFTAAAPPGGRVLASMPVALQEYGKQVVVHVVLVPPGRFARPY